MENYKVEKLTEVEFRRIVDSVVSGLLREGVDEVELFHGSPHDFPKFDIAYIGSGWGMQMNGFGIYLSTSKSTALDYSQGGMLYTVEVPDGRYIGVSVPKREALSVARKFFKYYTVEHEYGSEAYRGHENEFWENECKYIGDCENSNTLYGTVSSILGSDKEASEFFHSIGYVGLIVNADNGATGEKFQNYVIFDASDIKILKKEKV